MNKYRIIIVDDEPGILGLPERFLTWRKWIQVIDEAGNKGDSFSANKIVKKETEDMEKLRLRW